MMVVFFFKEPPYCTNLHSYQKYSLQPHLNKYLLLFIPLIIVTLTGMSQYLIMLLICCSLLTSDDGQFLYTYLLIPNCSMTEKKVREQTANLLIVKYTCPQFEAWENTVLMISSFCSDFFLGARNVICIKHAFQKYYLLCVTWRSNRASFHI